MDREGLNYICGADRLLPAGRAAFSGMPESGVKAAVCGNALLLLSFKNDRGAVLFSPECKCVNSAAAMCGLYQAGPAGTVRLMRRWRGNAQNIRISG